MTDFPKDTRLIIAVDEAGHLQCRLLTMTYERVAEHFAKIHAGTNRLPEAVRNEATPLCGIYQFVNGKWAPSNG